MMMSPEIYDDARRNAAVHAQIRVLGLSGEAGVVSVKGWVVRVFRNTSGTSQLGAIILFNVHVQVDRSVRPALSGTIFYDRAMLKAARWLEVFLQSERDGLALARSQLVPIRRPTWRPVCRTEEPGFCCRPKN